MKLEHIQLIKCVVKLPGSCGAELAIAVFQNTKRPFILDDNEVNFLCRQK